MSLGSSSSAVAEGVSLMALEKIGYLGKLPGGARAGICRRRQDGASVLCEKFHKLREGADFRIRLRVVNWIAMKRR